MELFYDLYKDQEFLHEFYSSKESDMSKLDEIITKVIVGSR